MSDLKAIHFFTQDSKLSTGKLGPKVTNCLLESFVPTKVLQTMATDILFSSPTIVPGDESVAPYVADVLIANGLIARIGAPGSIDHGSARVIDAKGHYLSPGFIDMHAHSDLYLLTHPEHEAKITQGCTVSCT
jgi:imidazolonepropionase-like amidohydrolase